MNEANIEAGIAHAIRQAFPNISSGDINHQLTFTITLGRKKCQIDAQRDLKASGRCDILLTRDGHPLAILELKSPKNPLEDADRQQALSYARLHEPMVPLVIITNGSDTQIHSTYDGSAWDPESQGEQALAQLFERTAELAGEDLRRAVEVLLGPRSGCWRSITHDLSEATLADLTGPWGDPLCPFPEGLIFPRKATLTLRTALHDDARCILITGPPLCGKSNVLREFALEKLRNGDEAFLFLDLSATGHGIFQTLANSLTKELGWAISVDNVRSWLIGQSNQDEGSPLILLLDGADPTSVQPELDELTSGAYGMGVRVVLTVDEAQLASLTRNATRRQATRIGRMAQIAHVGPLDDDEFRLAIQCLKQHRVVFMKGAHRALEYRSPWVLRAWAASFLSDKEYRDKSLTAVIPSMSGLALLEHTRNRFRGDEELIGQFLALSKAVLNDLDSDERSAQFSLTCKSAFACSIASAREQLSEADLRELVDRGYVKHSNLEERERILVPQVPDLMLVTMPGVLAERILKELRDVGAKEAASHLSSRCQLLFAGEVIGAMAILEAARRQVEWPMLFFSEMLSDKPSSSSVSPGMRAVMLWEGQHRVDLEFLDEQRFTIRMPDGTCLSGEVESPDGALLGNLASWLILSYIAEFPLGVTKPEENSIEGRIDPQLLVEVGSFPQPLRAADPGRFEDIRVHELANGGSVVCHEEGVIEPITYSIMSKMSHDREAANHIIEEALSGANLPLLSRIHVALNALTNSSDRDLARWSKNVIERRVGPALADYEISH